MKADDVKYFSAVSVLMDKIQSRNKRILELALIVGNEVSDPEKLKKINKNLFNLWEEAVHCNAHLANLEKLEEERYRKKT
jgi:spore cortex formation protein SpoVR/YcgB (stage V sporulation)